MKKIIFFFSLAILLMGLIACSGGSALIGKWSADKDLYGLAANVEITVEFKSNGIATTDYTIDGESQEAETFYYKIVDADTVWICEDRNPCTEVDADVVNYTIIGSVLTVTNSKYPMDFQTFNKVP